MAYALVTNSALTDIADAIRDMNGSADTYLPSEMPDAIRAIETGSVNPPEPVTGISAKIGHNKVGLLFDDPEDIIYTTDYATYEIVKWAGTRVVRKAGSAPSDQRDGTLVANSTVRDAHKASHLVDTGLADGTTYYYGLFPYSDTGKSNTDASQVVSVTPSPLGVASASNLSLKVGSGKVLVKWSDPADVADTSSRYGTTWASTKLVRKAGSTPSDSSDGTLLATATTRNQYSSSGYLDETPDNGTAYYYAAFAQSADGVESSVVAASATPSAMGVGSCTGIAVSAGNATATVTWTDPADVADTSTRYGTAWARTVLVRKAGSAPASASDGTVVVTETTRDQYKTSGYEDTGLTNGTTYYYAAFAVSSDGVTSAAATGSATPQATRVMGVRWAISQSNPATCERLDSAVGMTASDVDEWISFFGCYPVLLKNGVEQGKLKWSDFTKFEDGTSADITSGSAGDVMIAFPRRDLSITNDGTYVTVRMTDDLGKDGYTHYAHQRGSADKDVFYIGAYKASQPSGTTLRSLSGKSPAVNFTVGNGRTYAQANGSGYEMAAWYQRIYLQVCYMLMYANRDSQTALGRGYVDGNSAAINTGGTNAKGACFGETTGKQQMRFLGVEDFWGNIYEWCDGIYVDSSIRTATTGFNNSATGYTNQGSASALTSSPNRIKTVKGTSELGFFPTNVSGSDTTYFCDYGYVSASSSGPFALVGGYWSYAALAGAFFVDAGCSASGASSSRGARLMYLPA